MPEKRSLPVSCLEQLHFKSCPCRENLNPIGNCFSINPQLGEGYYWFYEKKDMFTIAFMNLRLKKDYIMEYSQPDFISINYYDTISAEELTPYKRLCAHTVRGYVSKGEVFRLRCHKDIPVKGAELMLMPGYYDRYLQECYPGEFPDPKSAFKSIDGCADFRELVLIFKQIASFSGSGNVCRMYYESKVSEMLSLIIEHTKNKAKYKTENPIHEDDKRNIDAVKSYIEDHFAYDIRTEQLSSIALMGQTKLRQLFKQVYGTTITQYIQNRRVAYAEFLLLKTDLHVGQISDSVGYRNAGRFCALFKKNTGLTPEEYRKILKKKYPTE